MTFKQGETVEIIVTMDEDLNYASAQFGFKQEGGKLETIDCTIEENVITTVIDETITETMLGYYTYEVKATDINGDVDIVKSGIITVEPSIFNN